MMRERLTITLKQDILKLVDQAVDGAKIRNRSHAIEYLIQKASAPAVSTALILAGGKGIKTHSFSHEIPKVMLPIGGKPVLAYTIALCKKHDISDVIISIGPDGQPIKDYFGNGSEFGVNIKYLEQKVSNVGTAPSLRQSAELVENKTFLLMYGDVVADINLSDLIQFHLEQQRIATMALTSIATTVDWGVVSLHGTRITQFTEKPNPAKSHSHVINAGIYCFDARVFSILNESDKKLEQHLFPKLAQEGSLSGYLFEGRWYDVGLTKMYQQLQKDWPIKH